LVAVFCPQNIDFCPFGPLIGFGESRLVGPLSSVFGICWVSGFEVAILTVELVPGILREGVVVGARLWARIFGSVGGSVARRGLKGLVVGFGFGIGVGEARSVVCCKPGTLGSSAGYLSGSSNHCFRLGSLMGLTSGDS
jgi:hypothetical protein